MTCRVKNLCVKSTYAISWAISIGLIVLGYRLGAGPSCSAPNPYMCYNTQSGKLVCCSKQENCVPIAIDCVSGVTDTGTYVIVVGLLILTIVILIGYCYLKNKYCTVQDRDPLIDSNIWEQTIILLMEKYKVFEKLKKTRHCSYYNAENLINHEIVTIKKLSKNDGWDELLNKK